MTLPVYQQTSASTETLAQVAVVYDVTFPIGTAVGGPVQIQGPAGTLSLAAQPDGSYLAEQSYATAAAAGAAFPNGSYSVVVGGSAPTTTAVTVSNGAAVAPVLITNYATLQAASSQPVAPAWAAISGAKAADFINLEVDDSSGNELFGAESGDLGLTPTATSLSIPYLLPNMGALAGSLTYGSVTASQSASGQTLIEVVNGFVVQFGLQIAVPSAQSQTVATGSTVVFNAGIFGVAATYQWSFNGTPIAGATSATYVLSNAQAVNAGSYSVTVTDAAGTTTSAAATLAVTATGNPGRLVNLSVRSLTSPGASTLIAGFVTGGAGTQGTQPLLIRGVGPTLAGLGVSGVLPDPLLQVWRGGTASLLYSNQGWGGNSQVALVAAAAGAFPLNLGSADAALFNAAVQPGAYSALVSGASGDSGVALAEVYDATAAGSYTLVSPRLVNVSGRAQVGVGSGVLIAGFSIGGATNKTVLIRASGPALAAAPFNLTGTLANPQLQLYAGGDSFPQWANTGWNGDPSIAAAAAAVGAFSWSPGSADAAILVTLPPGSYTAVVSGVNNSAGIALVEVYEVP